MKMVCAIDGSRYPRNGRRGPHCPRALLAVVAVDHDVFLMG